MNIRARRPKNSTKRRIDFPRFVYQIALFLLIIILLLLLLGFIVIPIEVASWVPYSVHSILTADYSADNMMISIPGLRMEVIFDAIQDLGTPVAWQSKATLAVILQGTIPTATQPIFNQGTPTNIPGVTSIPTLTVQVTENQPTSTGIITITPVSSRSPTPSATRFVTATITPGNSSTATVQATTFPTVNIPTATFTAVIYTSTPRTSTPTVSFPTTQPAPSSTNISIPTTTRTPTATSTRTPVPSPTQIPSPTATSTTRPSPTTPPTATRTPQPYPQPATPTRPPPATPTNVPYP